IHERSDGNPLFMTAIVGEMQKNRQIVHEDGQWRLTASVDEIDPVVPQTLQHALDLRFDQLRPIEQRLLRSASVAGERFSAWVLAPALDLDADAVEDLCEGLAEQQSLIERGGVEEVGAGIYSPCYEFSHSLYREGIYQALSEVTRSRLHRTIGERLQS